MHEAEKQIMERWNDYESTLVRLMGPSHRNGEPYLWHANPEQRAESFGNTLNLW